MRHFLTFIIIAVATLCQAQQYPLFSHYTINKFGFNPAVAGTLDRPEARLIYRNQWVGLADAPETGIVSLQGKSKNLPIGFGGYFYSDQAGLFKRTGGTAALSYAVQLDPETVVSLGIGGGYYNIRLRDDYNARDASDQVLADAMAGEWFPDFTAGVYLERDGLFVGFSVPQILEPKLKFSDTQQAAKNALVRHYYAMAGYKFRVSDNLEMEPSALVKFVNKAPTQYEGSFRIFLKQLFWIGASYRSDAAASVLAGVDINDKLLLGYAYDLTTSNLNTVSNGSHEITLGFRFGKPKDSDEDGIPDVKDKCPQEPGVKENDGCPEEDEEALAKKEEEEKEDGPLGDWDRDGIRNDIDKCPKIPGVASNQGCPVDDRDKDGIVDKKDECPDEAGSFALKGCPGEDRDEDGVVDALDKCPDEAGPKFNKGCPTVRAGNAPPGTFGTEGGLILPEGFKNADGWAFRNVYFDTDKDFIRKEYFKDLNNLAEFLVSQPDIKIQMNGHADERASGEYNVDLSKRRVESVMFYLINKGVKRKQIKAEYYGEREPADYRSNEPAWQLNRRVELRLLFE